jgi:thiol:disulfide interchange protein DsbD
LVENFINGLAGYLQDSFFLAYLAVYLGGVLVSFTPCMYPVVPITIAYIGARGSASRSRAILLSVVYVLGMALTYTLLGAVAALTGSLFGQIQSSPWTYFLMGNLCLLMGLSLLDVFMVRIPTPAIITRARSERRIAGLGGSFLIGAASGFVMGPCTAPALAVILAYAATRQNVPFAASLMFVFAVGMGTLLILLGTFAGLLAGLPRTGRWMTRINRMAGWILIGAGEYFFINAGILWV